MAAMTQRAVRTTVARDWRARPARATDAQRLAPSDWRPATGARRLAPDSANALARHAPTVGALPEAEWCLALCFFAIALKDGARAGLAKFHPRTSSSAARLLR